MIHKIIVFLLLTLLFEASVAKNKKKVKEYQVGQSEGSVKDFFIPKELIKKMEKIYINSFKAFDPVRAGVLSDTEIMVNSTRKYFKIKVLLEEETGGGITGPVRFNLPRGGGRIDFKNYITSKRANFRVKIQLEIDKKEDITKAVTAHFVSNSKKKKFSDDMYGAGCNKYIDVSNFFKNVLSKGGIEVNTTEHRYLSVLGGSFFFIMAENDVLYLGAVEFTNSLYPEYLCKA